MSAFTSWNLSLHAHARWRSGAATCLFVLCLAGLTGLAGAVAAAPIVVCPGGADPLSFRPAVAVPGGAALAASTSLATAIDASNGREWVAVAFLDDASQVAVALSGDGGCTFSAASGGFATVVVAAGPATGAPSVALRVDGGPLLAVGWREVDRVLVSVATALDGSFPAPAQLELAAASPPHLAVAPGPAPAALVAAWTATAGANTVPRVAMNADPRGGAAWGAPLGLTNGVGANLGAGAELVLSVDAAGTAGAPGVTVFASAPAAGGAHVARSNDAGASFGAWRRLDDASLAVPRGLSIAAGLGGATPTSAWTVPTWSGRQVAAPMAERVLADAARTTAGAVAWDHDRFVPRASPVIDTGIGAQSATATAVLTSGATSAALVAWEEAGEIHVSRRPLAQVRPNLAGGCAAFRLTGLDPPRSAGRAVSPAAAALGQDVVIAYVDDRSGTDVVHVQRSDSSPPLAAGVMAAPNACSAPPRVQLNWVNACDAVSQFVEVGSMPGATDFTRPVGPPPASSLLVEGLTPGATWYFRVVQTDSSLHVGVSAEASALTPSCSAAILKTTLVSVVDACPTGAGSGNGAVDPGEALRVTLRVRNLGSAAAVGPTIALLPRSPELSVRGGAQGLPDLAPGAMRDVTFDVDISLTAGCGVRLEMLAQPAAGMAVWSDLLALDVPAACAPCLSPTCNATADGTASAPLVICRNQSLTLDGSRSTLTGCTGVLQLEWWSGAMLLSTNATLARTPTGNTTYRLVARCSTDFNCSDETTVAVTVNQLPNITFQEDPPPPHCEGEVVTLTAETADPLATWSWATGEMTAAIPVTASGLPTVTVTDSNGCQRTSSVRIDVGRRPLAEAGPDRTDCGAAVIGTPGFPLLDYAWDPPTGLSDPRVAQPVAMPASPTLYTLTVTDATSGCSAVDTVLVSLSPLPGRVPDLRVGQAAGLLRCTWSADPAASVIRAWSELDVTRSGLASQRSPTALQLCEGATGCAVALPAQTLVFIQAVGTCAGGLIEGPN